MNISKTNQEASENKMNEKRIIDLEIKYMLQEDLLDELNKIVAKQQMSIDKLVKEVSLLKQQNGSKENTKSLFEQLKDEKPPHY